VTAALVAGLLAGYGVALPVGAVGTYLVVLTARTSLRIGAAAALGVATADGLYALAAVLGGTALAADLEPIAGPLRIVSGLVLVVIAARTAIGALRQRRAAGPLDGPAIRVPSAGRTYASLVGITALNPTTIVYFTALILGSSATITASGAQSAAFVTATAAASATWQLLLASSGGLLGRALTGRRGQLATAFGSSAVIMVLAIRLLV
jgi:arginine exporter protein ArgO